MTVHSASPTASMPTMERQAECRGCLQTVPIADGETHCLECLLRGSIPIVAARRPRPRRTPQPLSLEAKLRQSIDLFRKPVSEEPWP